MKQCRRSFCILFSLFLLTFSSGCAREPAAAFGQGPDTVSESGISGDKSGSIALDITPDGPFRLENAEGEFLDWDGTELTGTMKNWNTRTGAYGRLLMCVPATETLTFFPTGDEAAISVSGSGQWSHVEGTGITAATVESGRVFLEGDSMDFDFSHVTYDDNLGAIAESNEPIVRLNAHADGVVTITASADEFSAKGISGDYILQTMYSKDNIISKEVGFAEPGDVITQPLR